ncbi:MAG TPA: zf-HC2 domain-containing protein [Gemmatimonadales bacterium]|nr:zf-HC2 domain-containing protein [Gemmatimonadales bacterium]
MSHLSRTNCEEAFRLLNDFIDRRLTPEEMRIIQEHLEICAWCAREFNFEISVLHGLKRKLRQLDVPAGLLSRILSQLPAGEESP